MFIDIDHGFAGGDDTTRARDNQNGDMGFLTGLDDIFGAVDIDGEVKITRRISRVDMRR
jgi:hypothetical protein